jgi:hypothetical protein
MIKKNNHYFYLKKIKKPIHLSIAKDINKLFFLIYYFILSNLIYFYKTINFYLFIKIIKKHKISILLPTRNRPQKFERMLISLIKKSYNIKRIELLIFIDNDDKEKKNYYKIINKYKKKIYIHYYVNKVETHAKRNNFLLKKINNLDIVFPINDDMVFVSNNWDRYVDLEFSKINRHEPLCLWTKCNRKYKYLDFPAFPIVNSHWINKLGYLGCELFNFWYLDWWICDISRKSWKYLITNNIVLMHLHINNKKENIDEVHKSNFTKKKLEKDYKIWINTYKIRTKESKKLLK